MHALFVHGMGRSPLSGWPLLRQLKRGGIQTHTFGYMVTIATFAEISARLSARISEISTRGDYILIGHSLGGVLLRAAVALQPDDIRKPKHQFLLGSPTRQVRIARMLQDNPVFRALTGDCGQLLASMERMQAIRPAMPPVTGIFGIRGMPLMPNPFGREPNDGIVSISEVSADWITDEFRLPVIHTWLPSSRRVADAILDRLNPLPPKSILAKEIS